MGKATYIVNSFTIKMHFKRTYFLFESIFELQYEISNMNDGYEHDLRTNERALTLRVDIFFHVTNDL